MNERRKAEQLFNHFFDSDMGGYGFLPMAEAKKEAMYVVENIVESLQITTGHLTLRSLDQHEVVKDFAFWKRVEDEIERITYQ